MTVSINGTNGLVFNDGSSQATAATGFGFKSRIINGNMAIDQRNAGVAQNNLASGWVYTVDRWEVYSNNSSRFNSQQNKGSVTPPTGFKSYLGVSVNTGYSVGASDYNILAQPIEGFNTADLGFGASGASTVTLSFWVYTSVTGTHSGFLANSSLVSAYPFTFTVSSANTWTQISVTITGSTSGTWVSATNGIGLYVGFNLGNGSNFQGTANTWNNSAVIQPTGATSVVGTSGATFYITGVQLEKGSTATSFDYRPYGTELALCQRYYFRFDGGTGLQAVASGSIYGVTTTARVYLKFPTTMRSSPTLSFVGLVCSGGSNDNSVSTIATQLSGIDSSLIDFTVAAGTIGQGKIVYVANGSYGTYYIQGTSEL